MPSGRHRHSQPLHRMMPPLTVAASAAVLALISLFAGDTGLLRVLAVVTAAVACAGALLARAWDRSAGRRVAELITLRTRDEWHTDERVAELETDLEESREIRGRLERKLRGKRAELARLRTEHADLLRRFAAVESNRARAIEDQRRKGRENAPARTADAVVPGAPVPGVVFSSVRPAAYLKAADALRNLARNAATQQAQRTVADARRRDAAGADEPQGRHASGTQAAPVREQRMEPAATASAVLPYARAGRPGGAQAQRAVGGFDFFGTHKAPAPASTPEHQPAPSEVIDLTAHDETEQFDVADLRTPLREVAP